MKVRIKTGLRILSGVMLVAFSAGVSILALYFWGNDTPLNWPADFYLRLTVGGGVIAAGVVICHLKRLVRGA